MTQIRVSTSLEVCQPSTKPKHYPAMLGYNRIIDRLRKFPFRERKGGYSGDYAAEVVSTALSPYLSTPPPLLYSYFPFIAMVVCDRKRGKGEGAERIG